MRSGAGVGAAPLRMFGGGSVVEASAAWRTGPAGRVSTVVGMAKPTLRDRFLTPQVARALWSPLGILAAGGGVAAGIVVGLPILAAAGVGAAAYAVRVAVAVPKGKDADGVDPFSLDDPWRSFVWQAKRAQRQFADEVKRAKDGPLKNRLREIEERIDTGVEECWQVAQGGQALTEARSRVDLTSVTTQLSQLPASPQLEQNPALVATAEALQSQLDTARRMDQIIITTQDRLRLLDARLGELVTRVVELSVRPEGFDDLTAIGIDVDSVVGEMEALRLALAETDQAGRTSPTPMPLPAPLTSPAPLATASDPPGAPTPEMAAGATPPDQPASGTTPSGANQPAPGQPAPGQPAPNLPGAPHVPPNQPQTWPPSSPAAPPPSPGTGSPPPSS